VIVSLEEVKEYLRVEGTEEDALLTGFIAAAQTLCMDITRITETAAFDGLDSSAKTAVLFAVAYLYEHREEADHHELILTLRALLFGVRQEGF
jgi:uncharacterized phage protein (predicted DNA packaging)